MSHLHTTAAGPLDDIFLLEVYAATRRSEVACWGWPPAEQDAFLDMQFHVQQRSFQLQYPDADHQLILLGSVRVGRLLVVRSGQEILLADIALLPAFRNAGIGTALIRRLQAEALASDRTVLLRVLRGNPARGLYERLGFQVIGENGTHHSMEWRP